MDRPINTDHGCRGTDPRRRSSIEAWTRPPNTSCEKIPLSTSRRGKKMSAGKAYMERHNQETDVSVHKANANIWRCYTKMTFGT